MPGRSSLTRQCHVTDDPVAVRSGDLAGFQGDDFRDIIRMECGECFYESGISGGGGLENGEHFGGDFHISLPTVDRLDGGQEIDTSRVLRFDHGRANLSRLFEFREGAKDH